MTQRATVKILTLARGPSGPNGAQPESRPRPNSTATRRRSLFSVLACLLASAGVRGAEPLVPDPNAGRNASVFIAGSPGHYISRAADIFFGPRIDYNQTVAESFLPPILRAINRYDVAFDPRNDWGRWLTHSGDTPFLTQFGIDGNGNLFVVSEDPFFSNTNDDVLFIDLAAFYDDSEANVPGGFWANWQLFIMPIDLSDGLFSLEDFLVFRQLQTRLRGPFWSGEKHEVGDTDGGYAFRPQVMHYKNFGIWNWSWSPHTLLQVFVQEGDGGFADDPVASFVVRRGETTAHPVTIADTGDVVSLELTADGRFRRTKLDTTGFDADGVPRVTHNPDTHNVDIQFRTGNLDPPPPPRLPFGIGPNGLTGTAESGFFPWVPGGFNEGSRILQFVDNVSYTPGWDCAIPFVESPFDVDDDFEFFFVVGPDGVNVQTGRGGCDDTTTVFFRATQVHIPEQVIIGRTVPTRVSNGTNFTLSLPRNASMHSMFFSELLSYETADDDDVGFAMIKQRTPNSFDLNLSVFDGNDDSAVVVRLTALQWPACMPAAISSAPMSTRNAFVPFAHHVVDLPIGFPDSQRFVINEMLTYHPAGDDDMSWTVYFEPQQSSVDFQLASSNAGSGPSAFLESQAQIIQFPLDLGQPVAVIAEGDALTIDCQCGLSALVHLSGGGSQPNGQFGVSVDSIVGYTWRHVSGPGASNQVVGGQTAIDISLLAGTHVLRLAVEDECGNSNSTTLTVVVENCEGTGDANLDGIVNLQDFGFLPDCVSGPFSSDIIDDCLRFDFDCDGDIDLHDFSRFQQVFQPMP